MLHYRFYKLSNDGHITEGSDREFPNDNSAFATAMQMIEEAPLEVWQATRMVARVTPGVSKK